MTRRGPRFALFWLPAIFLALAASSLPAQPAPDDLSRHLRWRNIGPANMSGRISDFEALDADFTQVIIASASGGVFKSSNAGTTWEPIFDNYGSASIGDVGWFQKNPNIIWVGTGEECSRNSIAWGDGIYKSTDGGKTFTHMGLKESHSIGRVLTHPTDPDVVYVAATGHTWGYTGERGLFKTIDGGKTWQKLGGGLPDDGKTGAIDLVMDPKNPNVLYVSFWQRLRQPWRFDSGGPNGGIYKTTDAGRTWRKLTAGLPSGDLGRIGLAISRGRPNVLMAVVEHGFQPQAQIREADGTTRENPDYNDMTKLGTGIYRSEDGGRSWTFVNRMNNRPFYYSHIYINPIDDRRVYFLTTNLNYSADGGRTWTTIPGLHPDYHAMWLDPTNRDRFYVGQDAGGALTHDHGKTYIYFDNQCLAQFYAVSADMRDPYYVYGGLQDNGTWGGPSMHREGSLLTDFWYNIGGGDGFHTQNDPTDWRTVYGESQGGSARRTNVETRQSVTIQPRRQNVVNYTDHYPDQPGAATDATAGRGAQAGGRAAQAGGRAAQAGGRGAQAGGQAAGPQARSPFRFNWSTPIVLSPHNPGTVYIGGNHLFRSYDRGDHWLIVSPDLTTNDRSKIDEPTGGITRDQTGAELHCTIITISESPLRPGLIWVGTDDGNVQVTRNGGATWTAVRANVPGVPAGLWVSRVEASRFDEGTAYLAFDGHRSDDFKPYVLKTTDYGKTWTSLAATLPDGQPVYVVREDLRNRNLLFVGTEFSVFFSIDGGKTWTSLRQNMPTVAFHDLLIHPRDNDLIAATHGRGIWIMDDISALQEATAQVMNADAHLFTNGRPGTDWLRIQRGGYGRGDLYFRGENPPPGAAVHFYLKSKPSGPVTVEIADGTGQPKTTYLLEDVPAGITRLTWDLRFDPSSQIVELQAGNLLKQIEQALQRTDLKPDQKAAFEKARETLKRHGSNARTVQATSQTVMGILRAIGGTAGPGGMGGGQFAAAQFAGGGRGGAGGGATAGPGTYVVRLTTGGKTLIGKVGVRADPMLADSPNR